MTARARAALVIWLLLLTVLFALPVPATLLAARDGEYTCLVDRQKPPSNGVDYEWAVRARITLFPLGLECTFIRESGEEVVMGPGWLLTVFAGMAGTFGIASVAAMVWTPPQPAGKARPVAAESERE
ncbi:hypothetical protein [Rathayibacter sp. VKM Ac-2927]|uniref:hypothetical protein n=1 Tax=Rathayibacter sp. VKM Ac-2927 TaxID=2929478 RepID=UPI001FB4E484|nr:hypothetical protein [Rathayibacter sp. VKM Ac-2927]MCJ1688600.1 hypothetical protein [Rathayibacter sp. VKM Ac-2927]